MDKKARTEKRRRDREIVSKELVKVREDAEKKLRKETGVDDISLSKKLLDELYGDRSDPSRSSLSKIQNGVLECRLFYFYKYLKVCGMSDSEISKFFIKVVKKMK